MKKKKTVKRVFASILPALITLVGMGILAETGEARLLRGLPMLLLAAFYALCGLQAQCIRGRETAGYRIIAAVSAAMIVLITADNIAALATGKSLTGSGGDGFLWGGGFGGAGYQSVMSLFDPSYEGAGLKLWAEGIAHVPAVWMLAAALRKSGLFQENGGEKERK